MEPSDLLRGTLYQVARSTTIRDAMERTPLTRGVVHRFVPGAAEPDAVGAVAELLGTGRLATIDYLGEDTTDPQQAQQTRDAYLSLLRTLAERDLALGARAEVSVKLSALGQALPDGDAIALDHARAICEAATAAGTTVTIDAEDHSTTERTLLAVTQLRQDFPRTGAVVQAYLRRTEGDCRDLATTGSRVRLCKGAYREPQSVAYTDRHEIDKAYVRCLKVLMAGEGYPMVATHDPRLIEIASALAGQHGRAASSFEYQMLYGIRPSEQVRIADRGDQMRVYLPFGDEWYGYLVRRMAERPANLGLFLRGLVSA